MGEKTNAQVTQLKSGNAGISACAAWLQGLSISHALPVETTPILVPTGAPPLGTARAPAQLCHPETPPVCPPAGLRDGEELTAWAAVWSQALCWLWAADRSETWPFSWQV